MVIWLHIDDVEWAIKYFYVQNHLKGVPLVADDSTGPALAEVLGASSDW